jgi:transcription antitermination factor NusG
MLTKTTLDPVQVKQAEQLARRKWGDKSLEPHLAALIEPEPVIALSRKSYLLAAAPQQEARVERALRDAGFDAYLPKEPKSVRVNQVKRRMIMRPMLPGYVFPIFDEHREGWQLIQDIEGVLRLFLWGERPVPMPEDAVQRLRDREGRELACSKIKKTAAPYVARPGDFVQIDDGGSWQGFIGEVVDLLARASQLIVELDLFGRKTPIRVSVHQVTAL